MQSPGNLKITRKAEDLAVLTYQLTARFPREETYGLTSQMRRAAISIGSNIAEGCGRSSDGELAKFLHYSLGSATELELQLRIAGRPQLGDATGIAAVSSATVEIKRMLSRLIVHLRSSK